jgi:hypothetical protein
MFHGGPHKPTVVNYKYGIHARALGYSIDLSATTAKGFKDN